MVGGRADHLDGQNERGNDRHCGVDDCRTVTLLTSLRHKGNRTSDLEQRHYISSHTTTPAGLAQSRSRSPCGRKLLHRMLNVNFNEDTCTASTRRSPPSPRRNSASAKAEIRQSGGIDNVEHLINSTTLRLAGSYKIARSFGLVEIKFIQQRRDQLPNKP